MRSLGLSFICFVPLHPLSWSVSFRFISLDLSILFFSLFLCGLYFFSLFSAYLLCSLLPSRLSFLISPSYNWPLSSLRTFFALSYPSRFSFLISLSYNRPLSSSRRRVIQPPARVCRWLCPFSNLLFVMFPPAVCSPHVSASATVQRIATRRRRRRGSGGRGVIMHTCSRVAEPDHRGQTPAWTL